MVLIPIDDDDDVTLSFNSDSYIVLENEGSVEVCLILNAPLSIPALDVIVTTTATVTDTATAGVDFLENTSIVTLRAGKTEACTDILIVDDNTALEEDETFTSQLMLFFPIPVDISTALVTIIDDDSILQFIPTTYTVTEGEDDLVTLSIQRIGAFSKGAVATLSLVHGSATFGVDFDFRSTISSVTFAAGVENTFVHIQIPIMNDVNVEETEMFTAILTSTDQSVQIIDDTATVHILDDDKMEVHLINESPRVTASSVEAEFEVNGPVTGIRCFLRSQSDRLWQDCSPLDGSRSGAVSFTNLKPGLHVLKVHAYSRNAVVPIVKIVFVIASDPNYCSLVLVNRGVTVTGNSALITTRLYGPATQLSCTRDGGEPFNCNLI